MPYFCSIRVPCICIIIYLHCHANSSKDSDKFLTDLAQRQKHYQHKSKLNIKISTRHAPLCNGAYINARVRAATLFVWHLCYLHLCPFAPLHAGRAKRPPALLAPQVVQAHTEGAAHRNNTKCLTKWLSI